MLHYIEESFVMATSYQFFKVTRIRLNCIKTLGPGKKNKIFLLRVQVILLSCMCHHESSRIFLCLSTEKEKSVRLIMLCRHALKAIEMISSLRKMHNKEIHNSQTANKAEKKLSFFYYSIDAINRIYSRTRYVSRIKINAI